MKWPAALSIFSRKAAPPGAQAVASGAGGWYPLVREPYAGAWQQNREYRPESLLAFSSVFACVTLIAQDISKQRIKLVEQDADGIWNEVENPAYSPVLRKPNHYQTRIAFLEQWVLSKLLHGNTYILKERDARGVVVAMYVLDPTRVRVLVAPSGDVYYALGADNLAQLEEAVSVPASEIIHDRACALYHPLVGISPLSACGLAALQGLKIQHNSSALFANGSLPGGLLFVPPVEFPDEGARERLQKRWQEGFSGANAGKIAVLATDWKFETIGMNATDAQLVEQLKWTAETVCMAFHVPAYKIGAAPPPAYNNIEQLNQDYYSQALQNHIEAIELLLDEGLAMGKSIGTELDIDVLMRMDTMTRAQAAEHASKSGMSPNEIRARFYDLGPVKGGEVPYLQQQDWPIDVLSERRMPPASAAAPPPPPAGPPQEPFSEEAGAEMARQFGAALRRVCRAWEPA